VTTVPEAAQLSEPASRLRKRRDSATDEAFRFELFCRSQPGGDDFSHLDPMLRQTLLRQQFRAQSVGYRTNCPEAEFEILEIDGAPIGAMITDRSHGAIHILELAFLPDWRGLGIGSAILRAACEEGQEKLMPVRFEVYAWEERLVRLYQRLGFRPYERTEMQFHMEWRPQQAPTGGE
jgi:ribosomal protein S18 acetylase RimI-like enzyme